MLGLMVGTGVALFRVLLDRTVRTAEGLREDTEVPVLGNIPYETRFKKGPELVTHAKTIQAEAFRQLRTNLQFVDAEKPVGVLVVTSALPKEGKSTISTNLAISFSEAGKDVVLVDADMRRPKVADYLGLEGSVGLTNVLVGQAAIDDVLQYWGGTGLRVLPSGSSPPNPSELLGSPSMDDLIEELRSRFDLVVIDAPPLLPVTDAVIASTRADGAVLVCRYGKTRRGDVERGVEALRAVDTRVLGTILNCTPLKGVDARGYEGYASYQDSARPQAEVPPFAKALPRMETGRHRWWWPSRRSKPA
jgi:capsular exopolysaccharide synthesis family protein